jgi:hypothetical protein
MELMMHPIRNGRRATRILAASFVCAAAIATLGSSVAVAVDTMTSKDAPDLTSVRAKIKIKDYKAAVVELKWRLRNISTPMSTA